MNPFDIRKVFDGEVSQMEYLQRRENGDSFVDGVLLAKKPVYLYYKGVYSITF